MAQNSSTFNSKRPVLGALVFVLGFAIPTLLVLYGINHEVDKGFRKNGSWYTNEWKDIYGSKLDADILMLGSSRAWVHLNPRIFDSITGLNSYNLGLDAYAIDFQIDRFWASIHHNRKPKFVIQNMDALTLKRSGYVDYDGVQFLPFLNEEELRQDLIANGLSWKDRFFPIFKYRGRAETVRFTLDQLYFGGPAETIKYKGYAGQELTWTDDFKKFKEMYTTCDVALDPDMIKKLDSMIAYCAKEDIKVIIAHLPMYDEAIAMMTDKPVMDSIMYAFEDKYPGSCYYMDYSKTSFSADTNYFYNASHMNYKGADSISIILAKRLLELGVD